MACGVPVVSTDGGALPEVVGSAGRVVPAGDPAALETAIGELLSMDSAERESIGLAGRERILNNFSWARAADSMVDAYRGVIASAGKPST